MFKDNEFDFVVFSYNGLDCIDHKGRIRGLKEIYRVLKPDGIFSFSSHNINYKNLPYIPRIFTRKNPIYILKSIKSRLNYELNKKNEVHTDEFSIITCPVFNHTGYMYYIKKENQVKQLEEIGFKNIDILDKDGSFINLETPDRDFCWLYYACTK